MPVIPSDSNLSGKGLHPFHFFSYRGAHYRISIHEMSVCRISSKEFASKEFIQVSSPTGPDIPSGHFLPHVPEPLDEKHPVAAMDLFVVQSCNLSCLYCYGDDGTYGERAWMSEKTAMQAVDWLIDASGCVKTLRINFFGGEPLLNFPLMKTIVSYVLARGEAAEKKTLFQVTTNGTLLDDEIIIFLQKHDFKVLVSLDGPKDIHDKQRRFADGGGSYDAVTKHLGSLIASVPDTDVHAVIMGDTDPKVVINALEGFGFRGISVLPASGSLFSKADEGKENRDSAAILQRMEEEAELWIDLARKRDIMGLQHLKSYSQFAAALKTLLQNRKNYHPCGAAIGLVAVSCSGDIYPCHRFVGQNHYRIGNIFSKELDRTSYLKSPVMTSENCIDCFARFYCAGGCKQDNVISGSSLFSPSEDMCRIRRRQFELAAYITAELANEERLLLEQAGIIPSKPCPLDL